ncbi:uncharacterized protein EI90DRAFT_3125418 [Cantharellus anzutake]|uniref:uncharacterized protein n=1 Tax=Cantharellus anzutake TaxID=1750568 RepID=UPI0019047268|nr:uncharacterized protein EI90DRAFT_3125418 [Cantharellus anzutake]KAF8329107.1 hypothetical protein EI90DRAFT_3125418 [Cantharellus anzutake]
MSAASEYISGDSPKRASLVGSHELEAKSAKWVTLKEICWLDEDGRERRWEAAERKTRGSAGIDAVAIIAILRPTETGEALHTVIIEQYRPPVGSYVVEAPAGRHSAPSSLESLITPSFHGPGLIDEDEDVEQAGIRELEEETGLKASGVIYTSPLQVCDPGMTTANMKLIVVDVPVRSVKDALPDQKLEASEHIVRRIVPLETLNEELKAYAERGFSVDARLSHFAIGWELANKLRQIPMQTGRGQ